MVNTKGLLICYIGSIAYCTDTILSIMQISKLISSNAIVFA